jgi:peptide/nickel transport system substrate-binding protein
MLTSVAIIPSGAQPERTPIGTGAYRFSGKQHDHTVELAAFAQYWNGSPPFRRVLFRPILDGPQRTEALLRGEIDMDTGVPEDQRRRLEGAAGVALKVWSSASLSLLGYRVTGAARTNPLSDRRVRRAVSLAIDREQIIDSAFAGYGLVPTQMVPPTIFGYDPGLPPLPYDAAAARDLARQASPRDSIALRLEVSPSAELIGRLLARQLAAAGIRLDVDTVTWDKLYRDIDSGESPFYLVGFSLGFGDASEFLNDLHTVVPGSWGARNTAGFSSAKLDALLEQAQQEFDPGRRQELLKRAMRIAMEELPCIPLYIRQSCFGIRSDLRWTPRIDGLVMAREIARAGSVK